VKKLTQLCVVAAFPRVTFMLDPGDVSTARAALVRTVMLRNS